MYDLLMRPAKRCVRGEDLGQSGKNSMITEEKNADAYRAMTDSTRHLVRWTRDNARQWQRIKPDPETHPEAELDFEQEPTRGWAVGAGY